MEKQITVFNIVYKLMGFFDNKICLKKYRNKSLRYSRLINFQVAEPTDMYGKLNKNLPNKRMR